jgi:hypothetical protein
VRATLQRLQADLKTASAALDRRREEESLLMKALTGLQAEHGAATKHLAELRKSTADAERQAAFDKAELERWTAAHQEELERKSATDRADLERNAAAHRAELDAAHEKRRREILALEDQVLAIQSTREEIDALYAKIEAGGEENAAASLAAWKEAKKKKEELTGLLPKGGGIRVRPQGRTVLVRRAKEG